MPLKNNWQNGEQFNASDANAVADAVNAAYVKDAGGIPKADLAAAVQVSLGKADTAVQAVSASSISDSTATGRSVLTAADAAAARAAIGVSYGSTSGTVVQGNDSRLSPTASSITDSTATGQALITAVSAAAARTTLGVAYGTTAGTVAQGNDSRFSPTAASITDSTATGRALITTASASAARTTLGVAYGTTAGTVCQGNDSRLSPTASSITDSTTVGRAVLTATDAAAARSAIGAYEPSGFQPSDYGYLLWNIDPARCYEASPTNIPNLRMAVSRINVTSSITINNIVMHVLTAGTSLSTTESRALIYNSAGNLVAQTSASATASAWQSTGTKTLALTSAASLTSGFYYVAYYTYTTSTQPVMLRATHPNVASVGGIVRAGLATTAHTGNPAPSTLPALSATTFETWFALT